MTFNKVSPRLSDCNWTRTQNQLVRKRTLNHSRPFWPNSWVFVYELSGSGFKSSCSHLNFRFRACFEQGVPWHSGNYKVWIHSEMSKRHDKNIQSDSKTFNISLFNVVFLFLMLKFLFRLLMPFSYFCFYNDSYAHTS